MNLKDMPYPPTDAPTALWYESRGLFGKIDVRTAVAGGDYVWSEEEKCWLYKKKRFAVLEESGAIIGKKDSYLGECASHPVLWEGWELEGILDSDVEVK